MAPTDPEKERQRLAAHYASLTEGELRAIAADLYSLTDTAQQALKEELARRRLAVSIPKQAVVYEEDPDLPWPSPPVTIRRFVWLADADIARSILLSADVECFLADENIIRIDWFLSNAIGGVRLWVRDEESDVAIELLDQVQLGDFQVEGIGEFQQPRCPSCDSFDIQYRDRGGHSFLARLFFSTLLNMESGWRCMACGNKWNQKEEELQ